MPQNGNTVGRLIDLDHAKVVRSSRTIEACNGNSSGGEALKNMRPTYMPLINNEVIEKYLNYFTVKEAFSSGQYITEVVEFRKTYFNLDVNRGVKLDDIAWHYQVGWNSV